LIAQSVQAYSQNNEVLDEMYILARRLKMPFDAPRDVTSLNQYWLLAIWPGLAIACLAI